jgi:hypothetical protein
MVNIESIVCKEIELCSKQGRVEQRGWRAGCPWLMPVILASWEAEIRRTVV